MNENTQKREARVRRITDAISLREPDCVPLAPIAQCFPFIHAGYTMADILYDVDLTKTKGSLLKYLRDYEPDSGYDGYKYIYVGRGPIFELTQPKRMRWAGMPGNVVEPNSVHQFIEFPVLMEDEFEEYFSDRTGWYLNKGLPRQADIFSPFAGFQPHRLTTYNDQTAVAAAFSTPESKEMIQRLWKIDEMEKTLEQHLCDLDTAIEDAGFPMLQKGFAAVPFDHYSDFMRGTMEAMVDMYDQDDEIARFSKEHLQSMLGLIQIQGQFLPGTQVFMALHKGMDSFMSDEQYRKFYWPHLQIIINAIIDAGMTPFLFCEGKYDSRLELLRDVPKGKVIYQFEEVDMVRAKKILGETACICGGFPSYLLDFGTKEQVADAVKRQIDNCASGGGYIFSADRALDQPKEENFEVMVETVRAYGKY